MRQHSWVVVCRKDASQRAPALQTDGVSSRFAHLFQGIVTVNIDDSFDAKDLVGNYVCSDTPGSYVMQEGPLTAAVKKGLWIVIEDVDLASFDLLSVLIPLIETEVLTIQDREVRPHRPCEPELARASARSRVIRRSWISLRQTRDAICSY